MSAPTGDPTGRPAATQPHTTGAHPRFNHVAMSVPAELLTEDGRRPILDFYRDVFGWSELPQMTEEGRQLVLMAYEFGQFVFLNAADQPMHAPPRDHFGMSVQTLDELDRMLEKARAWRDRDERVRLVDRHTDEFAGVLRLTSFYVGYLLPLMVEVQHFDWNLPPAG